MELEYCEFLRDVFLFRNIKCETLSKILNEISPEIKEYSHKEEIYSPNDFEKKLGFVLSGECTVEKIKQEAAAVPLNTLTAGKSFGIMAVFSKEEKFPTRITAKKATKVLFIHREDVLSIVRKYPEIAMNVIEFLANKVEFLNGKVATFSADTVEEKLKSFLLTEYRKNGPIFSFNCKKSAESISAGRASLYRALTSLTEAGIIKLENKKIYILDPNGLERN